MKVELFRVGLRRINNTCALERLFDTGVNPALASLESFLDWTESDLAGVNQSISFDFSGLWVWFRD